MKSQDRQGLFLKADRKYTVHSYSYCKSLDTTRGDCMIKKEMIAMLLAGGQGSRLGVLTEKVAKPAVAFRN